ncbi:MAG TPA: hypothetical protein IAA57_08525 [Candidatus Pullilachnospira intestinigallinarum]|nr:hypothetical protein [Candidatus Pullilachnospira intestinigallinarum]
MGREKKRLICVISFACLVMMTSVSCSGKGSGALPRGTLVWEEETNE